MGIGAGAGIEADAGRPRRGRHGQLRPARAVTEHILAVADRAGQRRRAHRCMTAGAPARCEAAVITWPQFARMVRAAARGLSRRGVQEGDTAGIFVADAASHAVAVHAVRAAGAIAVPLRPAQTAADLAAQLKPCRARVLITSAALAGLAAEAAERCWVRQVFAFGEAAGTTPFGSLLDAGRPGAAAADRDGERTRTWLASGPDGRAELDGRAAGRPARSWTAERSWTGTARPR